MFESDKSLLKNNVFYTQEGRGNHWAYGYAETVEGFNENVMEWIRIEAENCDFYEGIVMMHSIAGGTGSGLGSRLMERYKEQFPKNLMINVVVWPHSSGETPLQNYNSLFTTSFIQKYSDAAIMFQNERMMKFIPKWIDDKKVKIISMKNLNEYISWCLKNILWPIPDEKISLYDITELAPVPQLKLLWCNTAPFIFNGKLSCDINRDMQQIKSQCISQIESKKESPHFECK